MTLEQKFNEGKYNELLYCVGTLWREYVITSKQYDIIKRRIDKEHGGKND